MHKFIFSFIFLTSLQLLGQNIEYQWVSGSDGNSATLSQSIVTDAEGNTFITGMFSNEIIIGNTTLQVLQIYQ